MIRPSAKPLTQHRALNYAMINQLATPGFGSLLAGRYVAGTGQLLLAATGCVLIGTWFVKVLTVYYSQMTDNPLPAQSHAALGWTGLALFLSGWLWALVTSISIYREAVAARRAELEQKAAALSEPPLLRPR